VAVPTVLVVLLGVGAEELPMLEPGRLELHWRFEWRPGELPALVGDGLLVAAVCSVQSIRALALVHAQRTEIDLDRELVAQGVANVIVGLAGGIPVSAVPKRSLLAVEAGGKTRRTGWLASLLLLAFAVLVLPVAPRIPIAALGGVVVALAVRLLRLRELARIARVDRGEAAVLVLTATSMVIFDFEAGIQAGVVAALALGLVRGSRGRVLVEQGADGTPHHVELSGPLTFLHVAVLDRLETQLDTLSPRFGLVLDMRHLDQLDHTAAARLWHLVEREQARGMRVALLGPRADIQRALAAIDEATKPLVAMREQDLDRILARDRAKHAQRRLAQGVGRFREQLRTQLSPLLVELADGQEPHTLFVTCSDSRVPPKLITGSQPGDLFVVRNIGALVPPSEVEAHNDEGAAIEYAVRVLGVRNIVVCGHSKCGAMKALKTGEVPEDLHALRCWSVGARTLLPDPKGFEDVDALTRATSVQQLAHVMSYPVVRDTVAQGQLTVSAWFYDVERGEVLAWSPEEACFALLGGDATDSSPGSVEVKDV
jgi:carbonic anhydrase